MKRITLFAVAFVFAMVSAKAQVIFEDDFENGLDNWTTYDEDGLTPAGAVDFITDGWNAIDRDGPDGSFGGPAGNLAAMSTSYYDPPGTSDDWLVSPQITLTTDNVLEFDAKAQDPAFADGYELRISTSGNAVEDFDEILFSIDEEYGASGDDYKHRLIDLSSYNNEDVYLAWVNNSNDKFLLVVDNVVVSVGADCLAPLGVDSENVAATEADIIWETVADATNGYNVRVFEAGDDPDTDTPVFEDDNVAASETSVTATGLSSSTSYEAYVNAQCDGSDSESTMTTFTTGPGNSDCMDATDITVGATFDENAITGTNMNGSTSDNTPEPDCGDFDSTSSDVWYTVTVPASGNVILETRMNAGPDTDIEDTAMQVYSGDCDNLSAVECNDDNPNGVEASSFSYLFLTGQTPGDELTVRVWGVLGAEGVFDMAAYEPDCLPVTDVMTDNYTDDSADVSWTEMGGATEWEVVHGEEGFDPEGGGTSVNVTGSPETTLTGLQTKMKYDVYVRAVCGTDSNSMFVGPITFAIPPANDDICDAIALTVDETCDDPEAYSNIGSTMQADEPQGSCYGSAGETTVWFSFVAPDGPGVSNVIVSTDIPDGTLTDTEIAIFEAPSDCDDASTMGAEVGCNEDGGEEVTFNSVAELNGLTIGDTYYVQVTGYGSQEGNFCIEVHNNACADPSGLSVSGIAEDSASLTWTPGGTETEWEVEYGETGFDPGNGTIVSVSDNPETDLDGLNADTDYDVYVTAVCSDEFSSAQVGPTTFTTFAEGECGQSQSGNDFENALFNESGGAFLIADDFIVDPNTTFTVDAMTASILTNSEIESINVKFYEDDAGFPGVEMFTLEGVVPTSQDITGEAFGYDTRNVEMDLDEPIAFDATENAAARYWVQFSVVLVTPDPDLQGAGLEVTSASLIGNPTASAPADDPTNFTYQEDTNSGDPYDGVFSITGSCSELGVDSQNFQDFTYYPNPVEGQLNLKSNAEIQNVEVYNLLGQVVMTAQPNQLDAQLNTGELQSGVYLMKVTINNAQKTFRIIKK